MASVFSENKEDAKAIVVLTLKNNAELAKTSVAGIKGLVAGAVRGLRTCNISIMVSPGQSAPNLQVPEIRIQRSPGTEKAGSGFGEILKGAISAVNEL